jgi:glutamate N-acetyltransferase/amino-acid N-acetyltransferase
MPTMPTDLTSITVARGFRAAGGTFGIKKSGKPDLALITCDVPATIAAVFTTSAIPSEPVQLGRQHVRSGKGRAIVCNSGCANASTGKQGLANALAMCARVASHLHCKPQEVLACSTGVIGHQLPMDRILPGIDSLAARLDASPKADAEAAVAIMTTDLVPKAAVRTVKLGRRTVTLGGICKGSGMISPNMATMLSFITTDAAISAPMLRAAIKLAVNADASFNRISVDTDTSPSDTVAILASGLAGNEKITTRSADFDKFTAALTDLSRDLAYQIIRDGEGVTRVIRVIVHNARSSADALKAARAVADSPLVKCAVHGGDPNWGRLTAAVGRSGAAVQAGKLTVKIGPVTVYDKGAPAAADVKKLEALMSSPEVVFHIDLRMGTGRCEFLGCDLSRDYITINADYHT